MARTTTQIETRDGLCEASIFVPAAGTSWPAVLLYMDGIGIRPALFAIAERIAAAGYLVLLPDLFYRSGPYVAPDPAKLFTDPAVRAEWVGKFLGTVTQERAMSDTKAFLDYLDTRSDVKGPKVGTTGYCMGGGLAIAAAAFFPDRVVAAASFHGGRLATDAPDSPHLLAPKMRGARLYVAGATEDASFPDEQKAKLDAALSDAGVEHAVVTYPAKHGWVPADTPVHDAASAERHFEALFELLASRLS